MVYIIQALLYGVFALVCAWLASEDIVRTYVCIKSNAAPRKVRKAAFFLLVDILCSVLWVVLTAYCVIEGVLLHK